MRLNHTISPKKHGKGSFPIPYTKMPIGIFLFALKVDFKKSEGNGEKSNPADGISRFVHGMGATHPVSRLWRVGARLPLVSKLPDGFAATADRIFCAERKKPGQMKEWRLQRTKKASLLGCFVLWGVLTKKMPYHCFFLHPSI